MTNTLTHIIDETRC